MEILVGPPKNRITILDSFRFIAILIVLLYHYFARYTKPIYNGNFYPYGNKFANYDVMKYGYLGVELFFMISGFVIFMTLEKSKSFVDFFIKRLSRLFPTILVCSIITFSFVRLVGAEKAFPYFGSTLKDFIPSLTFTDPAWWRTIFPQIKYIDGAYWSLAVEMNFYIISGIIFFLKRERFFENWIFFVTIETFIKFLTGLLFTRHILKTDSLIKFERLLFFPNYTIFFTLGILFYLLYNERRVTISFVVTILALTILQLISYDTLMEKLVIIIFILLFVIFVYKPKLLGFLDVKFVSTIGLISYSLYLIHQVIGIILISLFSKYLNMKNNQVLIVIPIVFLIIIVAYLINRYIENPSNKFLRKKIHQWMK